MTLITFTSAADHLVQTAVSWEIGRTLSNMGQRVVYLPLVPESQVNRLDTAGVEICKTPLEVRRGLLRSNRAMATGLDLGWSNTAQLMQMVRAGRRAGAFVIIVGGLQEQTFIDICLASDLTVQCVNPTISDIERADAQRGSTMARAQRFQLETDHIFSLFAQVGPSPRALSIARSDEQGEWLHASLDNAQGLVEGASATLQSAMQDNSKPLYTDTLYDVAREILRRAGGSGRHMKAMASLSWFLHVGLLRDEFNKLPPRRAAYKEMAPLL